MATTTSSADVELIDAAAGVVVPLMLARPQREDGSTVDEGPITIQEALVASGAGMPLSEWLEPLVIEDWFAGIGLAYDAAPGCDTFSAPGYVLPSGAATAVTLPDTNNSGTPIVAFAEYDGDLFVAQRGDGTANTARVMRSVDKSDPFADSLNLGAGEYLKDLLVARDPSDGATYLWASSGAEFGDTGRLHKWDGSSWTSTAAGTFGTNGRNRMVKVYWEGSDGVGDWRIVALSSNQGHVSYTRPGGDPMDAAGWIEMVPVGGGENVGEIVAARRHVYLISPLNVYDLDEQGNSPALTSYTTEDRGNVAPSAAGIYHDGFVYRPFGTTLDRVRVDQGLVLQEHPGTCSPGWGTKAESPWLTGYTSTTAIYQGGVLCGQFSIALGRVGIFWGKSREVLGVETPNPMVWHGPFAIGPVNSDITRMHVTSSSATPSSTTLWAATWPTSQVDEPSLVKISLSAPGGALQDLKGGGGHRFADGAGASSGWQEYSRLEGLATTVGDKGSKKHLYQIAVGTRGLPEDAEDVDASSPSLTVYNRADVAPGDASAWGTGVDVVTGPVADITPDTTSGYKLETRVDLFSPDGDATPPKPAILDSLRVTYWRTSPDLDTWTFDFTIGEGVYDLHNAHWPNQGRDVRWYRDALIEMCRGGRLVMRDRQDNRWSIKVKHFFERRSDLHDGMYGETLTGRLTVAILGVAA